MDMEFLIELGEKVVSNVSGFSGIITSRSEHLNTCNRYAVQPKVGEDGKLPDGLWFDECELLRETCKPVDGDETWDQCFDFENGVTVESTITKLTGIIVARSEHLNGCNHYLIAAPMKKDGTIPDQQWCEEGELVEGKGKKVNSSNRSRGGFPGAFK